MNINILACYESKYSQPIKVKYGDASVRCYTSKVICSTGLMRGKIALMRYNTDLVNQKLLKITLVVICNTNFGEVTLFW